MKNYLLLPLLVIFTSININNITGTVFSSKDKNEVLTGVCVTSSIDTTYSDFDGNFNVSLANEQDTLKFRYISYGKLDTVPLQENFNN